MTTARGEVIRRYKSRANADGAAAWAEVPCSPEIQMHIPKFGIEAVGPAEINEKVFGVIAAAGLRQQLKEIHEFGLFVTCFLEMTDGTETDSQTCHSYCCATTSQLCQPLCWALYAYGDATCLLSAESMGWFDCHLHAFRFGKVGTTQDIGIPDDEGFSDSETLPGWEVPIKDHFEVGKRCTYEYDFGDGWIHELTLQDIVLAEKGKKYPICLGGAMACPPEDCGGIPGYYRLIEVFSNPDDEEYEEIVSWLGRPFDPKAFDSSHIRFDNPKKRWDCAFSDGM